MKSIKKIFLFNLLLIMSSISVAQKQTFDVITYNLPNGWQQQKNEGGVQLSVTDKKTGSYALSIITKAIASNASANDNFNSQWTKLVKGTVQVNEEPKLEAPDKDNGWEIISGSANYTDGAAKGVATMLCATGGGQTVSVVLMTNTQQYQNELVALLNSLKLLKASSNTNNNNVAPTGTSTSSIVGLWVRYNVESSGYINGFPQVTGGYFRREYVFYGDGTYQFRAKDWSTLMKDILFVYEAGTWKANGNQLTITPKQGRGEWWGKAPNGSTNGWGSRKKSSDYKLEPVTYTFEMRYLSGMKETYLVLKNGKPTEREGNTNSNGQANEWSYSPRALDKSLIDNPPGFKTGIGK